MNRVKLVWCWLGLALQTSAYSADPKGVSVGGFIDGYYAFDFNSPTVDRTFTTQAIRHNEFSINMAYLEMKIEKERARGRVALQAGSSVYSNYAGERTANAALGGLLQQVQEAYGGVRLGEGLWLDAGIFLSHIGAESFISKDNWNYTRSLGADFSPYYQAGARLVYQASPQFSGSIHVLNGWQNIIENNSDKSLGVQLVYTPSETFSITYNNLIGRERELRLFHNFIVKAKVADKFWLAFNSDVGLQKKSGSSDYSIWYVETLLGQYRLSESWAVGGRVEYFHDRDQVVATTGTANGFQTSGGSINLDWQPEPYVLLRNEFRALFSRDSVFPGATRSKPSDVLLVTSLSLSF